MSNEISVLIEVLSYLYCEPGWKDALMSIDHQLMDLIDE